MSKIGKILKALRKVKKISKTAYDDPYTFQKKAGEIAMNLLNITVTFNTQALTKTDKDTNILFLPNHLSELDPPLLGSVLKAKFAGKAELLESSFFKFLTFLLKPGMSSANYIPIKRYPHVNDRTRGILIENLEEGVNVVFYPEATINHKPEVGKFRPALLKLFYKGPSVDAEKKDITLDRNVVVHPVAIKVEADEETRLAFCLKPKALKAVFNLMGRENTNVSVTIMPALYPRDFNNAEELAKAAQESIASVVNQGQKTFTKIDIPRPKTPGYKHYKRRNG